MASDWTIEYNQLAKSQRSYLQEAVMSLSNGYLSWRAAPIWSQENEDHAPGFYLREAKEKAQPLKLPNPQLFRFLINGCPIDFSDRQIVDYRSLLDLQQGRQFDKYTVRVDEGFISLTTSKYIDPINFHCIGFEGSFVATFEGNLTIESLVDLSKTDEFKAKDQVGDLQLTAMSDRLVRLTETKGQLEVAMAIKTFVNGQLIEQLEQESTESLLEKHHLSFVANETVAFDKLIVVATSEEMINPGQFARNTVESLPLAEIKANSQRYWSSFWQTKDIKLEAEDKELQALIRLNLFQLDQLALESKRRAQPLFSVARKPAESASLLAYEMRHYPEEQRLLLAKEILSDLNKEPDSLSLALCSALYSYQQITQDDFLLAQVEPRKLLSTAKYWLNKTRLGQDQLYQVYLEEGKAGSHMDDEPPSPLILSWLYKCIIDLPRLKVQNLLTVAKELQFDTKLFNQAKQVVSQLSQDQENENKLPKNCQEVTPETLKEMLALADLADWDEVTSPLSKQRLAIMAGALLAIEMNWVGLDLGEGCFSLSPQLPTSWHQLAFSLDLKGTHISIEITDQLLYLLADRDISVKVYDRKAKLQAGRLATFALKK